VHHSSSLVTDYIQQAWRIYIYIHTQCTGDTSRTFYNHDIITELVDSICRDSADTH